MICQEICHQEGTESESVPRRAHVGHPLLTATHLALPSSLSQLPRELALVQSSRVCCAQGVRACVCVCVCEFIVTDHNVRGWWPLRDQLRVSGRAIQRVAGWLLHHPGRQSHLPLQRQHVIRGPPRAAGSVPEGRHVVARPPQVLRYVCLRTTRSLPNDARRRLLHLGQRQPPPCESILHDVHNHICLDCRIRIHIYIYICTSSLRRVGGK